jgi:GT2 family glycosyltransferase
MDKSEKQTIAAVIVTFNRLDLLKRCIESIGNQTKKLDKIIVINNSSTDGTEEWLANKLELFTIKQSNQGSAGGFYRGIKTAFEMGYDWIWCMDDDAKPELNALESLVPACQNIYSALCSLVVNSENKIQIYHRGYFRKIPNDGLTIQTPIQDSVCETKFIDIDFSSFIGILINKEAIKKIGFPKKELFIYHDDLEYCLRLKLYGKIVLIPTSRIIHEDNLNKLHSQQKSLFHKISYRIPYDRYWITYYDYRNLIWLLKKIKKNSSYLIHFITIYFVLVRRVLFYDDKKFKRIMLISKSFLNGNKGNFDNSVPKKILYGFKDNG